MTSAELSAAIWRFVLIYSASTHSMGLAKVCDDEGNHITEELQNAKGIHDLDLCQLRTNLYASDVDKANRACTAHLVLVEGNGFAIAPATCFLPPTETFNQADYFAKQTNKGWAFKGKVQLSCGPELNTVELESTFQNAKAVIHPEFNFKRDFAQAHNIAIVRINKPDYEKAGEKMKWQFARPDVAAKASTDEKFCRCYSAPEKGKDQEDPEVATATELKVSRCGKEEGTKSAESQLTCLHAKESSPANVQLVEKWSANSNQFYGLPQTMACFCEGAVDPLTTLQSIGFYAASATVNKADNKLQFFSTPLSSNWDFVRSWAGPESQIGVTDTQMKEVTKRRSKSIKQCVAKVKLLQDYVAQNPCDSEPAATDNSKVADPFTEDAMKKAVEEIQACMSVAANEILGGVSFAIEPTTDRYEDVSRLLTDIRCQKTTDKISKALTKVRKRFVEKFECFGLAYRARFRLHMWESRTGKKIIKGATRFTSTVATGFLPGIAVQELLNFKYCNNNPYFLLKSDRIACKFFAVIFGWIIPVREVEYFLRYGIIGVDAVVGGAIAAGYGVVAAAKNK